MRNQAAGSSELLIGNHLQDSAVAAQKTTI
jgi:hypothetical protein